MCGIAGILTFDGSGAQPAFCEAVRRMAGLMQRRGPDDEGYYSSENGRLQMGFRRLAILNLTPAGHQPMVSGDGRSVIVFNGEIYNFIELRRETMNTIRTQFPPSETQRLLEQFHDFQMLTWKEIRELSEAGVEIGSHGVDHEIHHAAQDPEIRRRELVESKKEIQRQLGKPCRFFAFPNGDYCERSARELEEAGYELAFTTQQGFIRPDSNRFQLPRISAGGSIVKLKQQLRTLR